ncbi:14817_t:CDS:2 [Rhizophagus irregularis]|nr:14817_t:CDS:2 [Rhizophagus irregularis]
MNVSCRCYNCNTNIPTNTYVSSNNSDKQNLVLQICKGIFEAIQNENTTADISCSMSHKQIRNTNEVEECINKEFGQLFRNNVLRKEISSYSIFNTWRIRFKWSEFNNDSLIKNLLKISKEWYNPFTNYLQRIDNFVFASYSGIFIKVTVNTKDGHRFQSLKNKNKSLENFEGKYVTLLRATYNHDEDDSENATLEFIDDSDEIIVQNLKKIHTTSLQRYDNNRNREEEIVDQIATVAAGAVVGIAAVAAVAGVGFLAYKAATNKTVRRAATAVSYGQLAYSLIKEFEEFEEKNERERNNDDD